MEELLKAQTLVALVVEGLNFRRQRNLERRLPRSRPEKTGGTLIK